MAYESLNRCTDELAREYERTGNLEYLLSLSIFYSTVLRTSRRFQTQARHAEETIRRINPSFATGYFDIRKNKKNNNHERIQQVR
jgi:hypothetical protein